MRLQCAVFVFLLFSAVACQAFSSVSELRPRRKVREYLSSILLNIRNRYAHGLRYMMSDWYTYKSCSRTYSKEETIQYIIKLPADKEVDFDVKDVHELSKYYAITVQVTGIFSEPTDILFKVTKKLYGRNYVFTGSERLNC